MLVILFDDMKEDEWNKIYSDLIKKTGTQEEGIKETSTLYDAGFKINRKEKQAYYRGQSVRLSRLEFQTLSYLAEHPKWIFTQQQIYEAVWKEPGEFCGSAVTNVISQLRRKLKKAGVKKEYVQTVINQGYKFVP